MHDLTDNELLIMTDSGNRSWLKEKLAERAAEMWYGFTYDQGIGLTALIKRGVGPKNLDNINPDITPERFKLKGTGVRTVKGRIVPYTGEETREQAAKRIMAEGNILGNTGDLAGFLHDHPEEVEKWNWVDAISKDSRWTHPDGYVYVPYARVGGARRRFDLHCLDDRPYSGDGVLVLSE